MFFVARVDQGRVGPTLANDGVETWAHVRPRDGRDVTTTRARDKPLIGQQEWCWGSHVPRQQPFFGWWERCVGLRPRLTHRWRSWNVPLGATGTFKEEAALYVAEKGQEEAQDEEDGVGSNEGCIVLASVVTEGSHSGQGVMYVRGGESMAAGKIMNYIHFCQS